MFGVEVVRVEPDCPLLHAKLLEPVPPLADTLTLAVGEPQVMVVLLAVVEILSGLGSVMVTLAVADVPPVMVTI